MNIKHLILIPCLLLPPLLKAEEAAADQEPTIKPYKETAPSGDRELVEKLLANPEAPVRFLF